MPSSPVPVLFAEIKGKEIFGGFTNPDDYNSEYVPEYIQDATYSLCGVVNNKRNWMPFKCDMAFWDEVNRGHIVWLRDESRPNFMISHSFAVVPSGSLLSTGKGNVRIITMENYGQGKPILQIGVPFKSTSWALTAGIPPTTRALDYSMTTKSLVRKTPKVSQVGNISSLTAFETVKVFMTNDPSSPTHWLSQIRLDLQGGSVQAGVFQSTEIDINYDVVTTCNYQTCNGCLDLNIQRLCYGAQV